MATFNNGESLASVRTKINDAIDKIDGNATISNDISVGGNITVTGTVDGRDVAADGTKLDGIEASATADQTGSEIKALYEAEADTNAFTDAEQTKLSGIEASADVTDTANVTAAGALMDSELTSEASVKALDQGVATTDSPTFAGVDITGTLTSDSLTVSPSGTQQFLATIRANSGAGGGLVVQTDASDDGLIRGYDASGNVQLQFDTDGGDSYIALGNVGIGNSSPATALDVTGTITSDSLTVDGDVELNNTSASSGGKIYLDGTTASAGDDVWDLQFRNTVSGIATDENAGSIRVEATNARRQYDMIFSRSNSGTQADAMRINFGGDITFYDTSGNASFVYDESAGSTFNEQGDSKDFRVESDSNTNMLFVDGSNNRVGVGATPEAVLDVYSTAGDSDGILRVYQNTATSNPTMQVRQRGEGGSIGTTQGLLIDMAGHNSGLGYAIRATTTNSNLNGGVAFNTFTLQNGGPFNFWSGGVVNENGNDSDFRVESDNNANMLFVDAGIDRVGIGTNGPISSLDVMGSQSAKALNLRSGDTNGASGGGVQIQLSYDQSTNYAHSIRTRHDGSGNVNNAISFYTWATSDSASDLGTARALDLSSAGAVFNDDSRSVNDFRVESDNNTHMLFVDAGDDRIGIADDSPDALLHVGGVGDSMKVGRINSTIRGGGAANHNWFKICNLEFLTSSFAHTAFRVQIVGSGGTSGEDVHMDFMLFKKQQSTTDRWTIKPFRKHGMDLAYKWDSSGGTYSTGLLELWIASEGVNYQVFDIRVQDLQANPANSATYGEWQFTDTGSETQPSGSTIVVFPLTGHQTRYTQGGLQNSQFVVNDDSDDVDFRVESDSSGHLLFCDAGNDRIGIRKSSPSTTLDISGTFNVSQGSGGINVDTNGNFLYPRGYSVGVNGAQSLDLYIQNDGRLGILSSSSRFKTNISDISSASVLNQLRPVRFNYTDDDGQAVDGVEYGLIAEEVAEVDTDLVAYEEDGTTPKTVHYRKVNALLLKLVQEQQATIETLEARITALENA